MYIKRLIIKNFKSISDAVIDLDKGINLIIGDNGIGKTSILEAISIALNSFLLGIKGIKSHGIKQEDVYYTIYQNSERTVSISYQTPTKITCDLSLNGKMFTWTRSRKDETGYSKTIDDNFELKNYANKLTNDPNSILPILCYESDYRMWKTVKKAKKAILSESSNDRRLGYIGCLDDETNAQEIKDWCFHMELASFQRSTYIKEYDSFKKTISCFMQNMSGLKSPPQIIFDSKSYSIMYNENGQINKLSDLSAGYQSLLWMIMDIAHRMAQLNPMLDDLSKSIGIILIDELDMHLHPKWQWNIINALEKTFPNAQIIAATHSPIIISSCKSEHLIDIDNEKQIFYLPNSYGYSINDVVSLRQGSSSIIPELKTMYNNFDTALNEEKYDLATNIVQNMEQKFGADNTEVKRAKLELGI